MVDYNVRRWLPVLFSVRGTVLPALFPRILLAASLGGVAVWLAEQHKITIAPIAHTLIGVALGLLLVFRTNTAYDRYWEGRRLFGTIVNRSRDLTRQLVAWLPDSPERATLLRQLRALSGCIRQHVRMERDLTQLGDILTADERLSLEALRCRPTAVAMWISRGIAGCVDRSQLSPTQQLLLDGNLTAIVDSYGGAERILKTPIPFAYAHHIKLFLTLFCFTAPLAMTESMGRLTPLAAALLAFGLFGIEEIGVEIEDPFGYDTNDLPLDRIGDTIDGDVRALGELSTEQP